MTKELHALCAALFVVSGSNDEEGPCWRRGEDGPADGAGGSWGVGAGVSEFGKSPPPDSDEEQTCNIHGGASGSYKTCTDMYEKCQEIGGKCTSGYPGCDVYGQTSCGRCLDACKAGTAYPPECKCRSCGFTE